MPVLTTPPMIGGTDRPVSGKVTVTPSREYVWDGQPVLPVPQHGLVSRGYFTGPDGMSPLELVPTPVGVGMYVVLSFGDTTVKRTVAVPSAAEVAWDDLVDLAPASIVEQFLQGPPGEAARITSVSAATLPQGSSATVTAGGTSSDRTFLFGIPRGDKGDAGTITSVSAATLPAGSAATVTAGGTPDARSFAFGIPKGDPGVQGIPGTEATTAWRDITSLVPNRTGGSLTIRRDGATVWLNFDELACTDSGSTWQSWAALLPAGFRPRSMPGFVWTYAPIAPRSTTHAAGPMRVNPSGDVLVYNSVSTQRILGLVSWPTPDAWPATLPGTAY